MKQPLRILMEALLKSPKTLSQLERLKSYDQISYIHTKSYLEELMDTGYVYKDGEMFCLSKVGQQMLEQKKSPRINKVWGNENYDGKELKTRCTRPGAYDFQKFKSLL